MILVHISRREDFSVLSEFMAAPIHTLAGFKVKQYELNRHVNPQNE